MNTADAILRTLESPNVADSNLEPANVVDVLQRVSGSIRRVSSAICADDSPGQDETDGTVSCLTEAVMGVTAGLCRIASAIQDLADAVRESIPD